MPFQHQQLHHQQQHQTMCPKPEDPIFEDDQEDILMSYLNSEYMSTTSAWPTTETSGGPPTPNSTSTYGQSPISTPDVSHIYYDAVGMAEGHHWNQQQPPTPTEAYHQQPMIDDFSLIMSNHYQGPIIPYGDLMYDHIEQYPSISPPGSSVCSSDSEQSKKRRGRKKRALCTGISRVPNTLIAPALPVVKQLATILPAQKSDVAVLSYAGMNDKYKQPIAVTSPKETITMPTSTSITSNVSSQKAATIAKRQERLIKNRAAALLSRKRKREHLNALEDERNGLAGENDSLRERVMELEKANLALEKRLEVQQNNDNKSVMMFMLIIFFFAYFVSGTTPKTINTTSHLPFLSKRASDSSAFQLSRRYNDEVEN